MSGIIFAINDKWRNYYDKCLIKKIFFKFNSN